MSDITQQGWEELFAAIFHEAMRYDTGTIEHMAEVEAEKLLIHHSTVRRVLRSERKHIKNEIANYLIKEARDYPCNPIKNAIENKKKLVRYLVKKMLEK